MRYSLRFLSLTLLTTSQAWAQIEGLRIGDDDDKPVESEERRPSSYDESDLAYKEKRDEGPYAPKSKEVVAVERAERSEGPLTSVRDVPRKPLNLDAQIAVGFGKAPLPGPVGQAVTEDTTSIGVTVGGSYDVSEKIAIGLAIPWATANVGTRQSVFATPQLYGQHRSRLGRLTGLNVGLSLGLPAAQGSLDISSDDLQAAARGSLHRHADATLGYRSPELFAPNSLPLVPSVELVHYTGSWELHAFTKVAAIFWFDKVQNPSKVPAGVTGSGVLKKNGLALRSVTGGGGTYQFSEKGPFFAGLDGWLALLVSEPVEFSSSIDAEQSPLQLVVEPRVGAAFGAITPTLGYILPLGGRLGGSGISGLRLAAAAAF